MKFKLKVFAAALVLAASVPAHAKLDGGTTGNGELFFNVYDTVSKQSFTFDLTPVATYSAFGTFTLNDFLPANLNNAQGLPDVTAGQAVPSVTGFNTAGAAEASNININWDLSNNTAFSAFAAANTDTSTWQWNVVALDSTGTSTTRFGRQYLSTVANSVTTVSRGSGDFSNLLTVEPFITTVNAATPGEDEPSVYLSGANTFATQFGDGWKGRFVDSTSAVGDSARFFYLTGRSSVSISEEFENGAAFKFTFENGVANLNYSTAAVPEPESYAMMLAGLGLMGFVARRRRSI